MSRTEALTRKEIIDKRLAKAGWNVKDPMQVTRQSLQKSEELLQRVFRHVGRNEGEGLDGLGLSEYEYCSQLR